MKKIYFAGSIRGGRDDAELYQKIIKHLTNYGVILTEHVGDANLSLEGQHELSDTFIHDRDMEWLLSSDVIVGSKTLTNKVYDDFDSAKKIVDEFFGG